MKTTLKAYLKDPKNRSTVDVGLFIILILGFHYLYLGWQALDYWPIKGAIDKLSLWSVNRVFRESCWMLRHIFGITVETVDETRRIFAYSKEWGYVPVTVAPECASLKQWMHWLFLMLLFPGPWKHKAWYIPAGLVVIEWTNVLRICGIQLMQVQWGTQVFHLAHNYIFKVFFYLVIFLMWVLWVEKFKNKKATEQHNEPTTQP